VLDEVEAFLRGHAFSAESEHDRARLREQLSCCCFNAEEVIADLLKFCTLEPRLPAQAKTWEPGPVIHIPCGSSREEIIDQLEAERAGNPVADLAFQAYRDMRRTHWKPFIKAALERNPVSIRACEGMELEGAAERLRRMDDISIYEETRMAQPDEVWNFQRGDGLEKALCLMNIARSRYPQDRVRLGGGGRSACVSVRGRDYRFKAERPIPPPVDSDFSW
jgi:hypothetical protein